MYLKTCGMRRTKNVTCICAEYIKLQHQRIDTCVTMTAAQITSRQSVLSGTKFEAVELCADFQILALPFPFGVDVLPWSTGNSVNKWTQCMSSQRKDWYLYGVWETSSSVWMRESSWTTLSIFGRSLGFWAQHHWMRAQISSVMWCASGRFGLFPRKVCNMTEHLLLPFLQGSSCAQT